MEDKSEVIANSALENLTQWNHLPFFIESSLGYSFFNQSLEYDEYDIKPRSVIDGGSGIDTLAFDQSLLPPNLHEFIYLFSDVEGHVAFDIFANGQYHLYETYNIEYFQFGNVRYSYDELFDHFEHDIFHDQTFYNSSEDDVFVGSAGEDTAVLNITFDEIEAYHIEPVSHFSDNTADHQVSILSGQGFDSYTDIEYFAFLDNTYTFDQLVDSLIYYDPGLYPQDQSGPVVGSCDQPNNLISFLVDDTDILLKPDGFSYFDYEHDIWKNYTNEYRVEYCGYTWVGLDGDAMFGSAYSDFIYLDPANTLVIGSGSTDFVKMNYSTFDIHAYELSGDLVTFFKHDGAQVSFYSIQYFVFDDALINFEDLNNPDGPYASPDDVEAPIVRKNAGGLVPLAADETGVKFVFEETLPFDLIDFQTKFDAELLEVQETAWDTYGHDLPASVEGSEYGKDLIELTPLDSLSDVFALPAGDLNYI